MSSNKIPTAKLDGEQSALEKAKEVVDKAWIASEHLPEEERKERITYSLAAYFHDNEMEGDGLPLFMFKRTPTGSFCKISGDSKEVIMLIAHHLKNPEIMRVVGIALASISTVIEVKIPPPSNH